MERLTKRNETGTAYYYPNCVEESSCMGSSSKCDECEFTDKVCEKLGKYEDTGLTPEQIKEIDRLYAEKCKELAKIKKKIEELSDKYLQEAQACANRGDERLQAMKEHVVFALMQVEDIVKESGAHESK